MKDQSILELMEGMKESADEILYETTRKLKDGRIKDTVTGEVYHDETRSIHDDDYPQDLGNNKGF